MLRESRALSKGFSLLQVLDPREETRMPAQEPKDWHLGLDWDPDLDYFPSPCFWLAWKVRGVTAVSPE